MTASEVQQLRFAAVRDIAHHCDVEVTVISERGRARFPAGQATRRADVETSGPSLDDILAAVGSMIVRDPDLDRSARWDAGQCALVLSMCREVHAWVHALRGRWSATTRVMPVPPAAYATWVTGETREVWASGHATRVGQYAPRGEVQGYAFTCEALDRPA